MGSQKSSMKKRKRSSEDIYEQATRVIPGGVSRNSENISKVNPVLC